MAIQIQDFEIAAGDDLDIPVTVTADGTPAGDPVSIAGAQKIVFAVADYGATATRRVTLNLAAGVAITDGPGGAFTASLSGDDTVALSGRYRHQARVTDSEGNRTTVFMGTLTVQPTILAVDE